MHSERLHAVLMDGVKRMAGGDATLSALCHLKHLKNKHIAPWKYS